MNGIRKLLVVAAAAAVGFASAYALLNRMVADEKGKLAQAEAKWQAEREAMEEAWQKGKRAGRAAPAAAPVQLVQVTNRASAAEILERLKTLRAGTNSARGVRVILHQFESLVDLGPAALPAIRAFLAQNLDVEYEAGNRRGFREGRIPTEFNVPPSLRLGLLEVARNIGGEGGEQVLAEVLKNTGRGAEVAYATYALQELAPNRYRDAALAAARELLARPLASGSSSPLDRFDRDYLYGVLSFFNDGSYVATAQAQMVQPDGKLDAVAVRYLQKTLGQQSVALAAQAWQDTRIAPDQKEPLARVALTYAGLDAQADQLYQTAINDANLAPDSRKNLIEDLNEAGFADPRHLSDADLSLIQKRIGMIEQWAPNAMDQVNADAFKEAYKDLVNMRNSLLPKPAPAK